MYPYSQLFGKIPMETAFAEKEEELVRYVSYCAVTNALAYPVLKKELKRIKSLSLYEEIEMPLIFTLHEMEQWGVLVQRQALKEYGKKLGSRQGKSLISILQGSLAISFLIRCICPMGKKQRQGILHQQRY